LYQLAVISGTTLGLVPAALSQVIYPRMSERFGRSGNLQDILSMAWRPMAMLGIVMIPSTLVAFKIRLHLSSIALSAAPESVVKNGLPTPAVKKIYSLTALIPKEFSG